MPSTLLGTLHMRDFGTDIADIDEEVPLYWRNRQNILYTSNLHIQLAYLHTIIRVIVQQQRVILNLSCDNKTCEVAKCS